MDISTIIIIIFNTFLGILFFYDRFKVKTSKIDALEMSICKSFEIRYFEYEKKIEEEIFNIISTNSETIEDVLFFFEDFFEKENIFFEKEDAHYTHFKRKLSKNIDIIEFLYYLPSIFKSVICRDFLKNNYRYVKRKYKKSGSLDNELKEYYKNKLYSCCKQMDKKSHRLTSMIEKSESVTKLEDAFL